MTLTFEVKPEHEATARAALLGAVNNIGITTQCVVAQALRERCPDADSIIIGLYEFWINDQEYASARLSVAIRDWTASSPTNFHYGTYTIEEVETDEPV